MNHHLIMIVDDSTTNIDILASTLKDQYRITIAKDGETALKRLKKQTPDLILLDIVMPEMDGFEVCRHLKDDPATRDIPVIFITAMEEAEQKTQGFALGAVDYIVRPFHAAEVLARVKTHLDLQDLNKALARQNLVINRALEEKSRQLDALIANLPGMVYHSRFQDGWHMEFVSDGAKDLTGHSPDHFLDTTFDHYTLMAESEACDAARKTRQNALERREPFAITYPIRTAAGHRRWVLEQGMGVYDTKGSLTGAEGVICDVTERQQQALALENENRHLKSGLMPRNQFGDIVGSSQAMQQVYDRIVKAASCSDSVIIYGPSGTGKELVARAIHKNSRRSKGPFIPINCGAIPEALIESEFFGHAKGAFSGANTYKQGVLDMADGGTLFLDELGEISMAMQVKLLRVMDGNGFIPVGGTAVKKPDIRFISATNRNLQQRVKEKKMRDDFFFRVHIIPITLPALKERKEDIPLLIEHFLNSYPDNANRNALTPQIIQAMQEYAWPGNVRQLQNMIYQFLVLGKMDFLDPADLSRETAQLHPTGLVPLKAAVQKFEKEYIIRAFSHKNLKKGEIAGVLGMDRKTLFRKMKRYGLDS